MQGLKTTSFLQFLSLNPKTFSTRQIAMRLSTITKHLKRFQNMFHGITRWRHWKWLCSEYSFDSCLILLQKLLQILKIINYKPFYSSCIANLCATRLEKSNFNILAEVQCVYWKNLTKVLIIFKASILVKIFNIFNLRRQ